MRAQGRIEAEQYAMRLPVTKTATCTLKTYETSVEIDSTAGAMTVTLPPAAEMRGKIVFLYVTVFVGAITIAAGDSQDFTAPTFDGVDDGQALISDGKRYWPISTRT